MKKIMLIIVAFVLLILIGYIPSANAEVKFVECKNNIGYVYSDDKPDVKYYIQNVPDFFTFIVYAVVHRNDSKELELIGDSMFKHEGYYHKYEVLAGGGEVHIYFYRMLDNDFADELYTQLTQKQIHEIMDALEKAKKQSSKSQQISPQTVSTAANTISNVKANDAYGTLANISRLTSGKDIKNIMLKYHPMLSIKDVLNSGINEYNITELYTDILTIIGN